VIASHGQSGISSGEIFSFDSLLSHLHYSFINAAHQRYPDATLCKPEMIENALTGAHLKW
jgi:hypothetical protein